MSYRGNSSKSNKDAAIAAGYSPATASAAGSRLVKDNDVALYIAANRVQKGSNAGDQSHPIMRHMRRPGEEKRSVVILRPDDWEEWLTTPNVEAARAMLQLYPAQDMAAEPAVP
ncbi:terminase small subunit [Burkholderia multivorans]|uniref:terminase small subunit n=1 Tax=Burkholderia multivorans TaxID=87883 RepID=UPI0009B613E2